MANSWIILFVFLFSFGSTINVQPHPRIRQQQECLICELDDIFNVHTNYSCFNMGLNGYTICTCPDGQYTMNKRCRLCDRPNICGTNDNIYCSETPSITSYGYMCFCPDNQFSVNKPCPDLTITTQTSTIATTTRPVVTTSEKLGNVTGKIVVLENGKAAERSHTAVYGDGAAVRGLTLRTVGIHSIRIRIDRMFMNKELFIGIQSTSDGFYCYNFPFDNIGTSSCSKTPASGWFGNNTISIFGQRYTSASTLGSRYNGTFEQYYMTNDIVTLIIDCETAIVTLRNERTHKVYHMNVHDPANIYGKLPWLAYFNLMHPGDKISIVE